MRKQVDTVLYCQTCSNKFLLEDNLVEVKINNIPGGIPYVDKETGKVMQPPELPRRRMFKCPKCGRGVASKMLTSASKEHKVIFEGDFRERPPFKA